MLPSIPIPDDYDVSTEHGFLPTEPPIEQLPDSYYEQWEYIIQNLQGLILSKRLREVVDRLPVLTTDRLCGEAQWRRAYSLLAFVAHGYIWGGGKPADRVPPPITIPFLSTCKHLELPPVATYAGLVLWNWKPIFDTERTDTLANLDMIDTFTGSLDEKWFYLVSVAIEARGGQTIPLMLHAMQAARRADKAVVTECLRSFAERLDEVGMLLMRIYDNCDPHVFYHRIRPYLAGSSNMADAGLPNGVIFDDGGPVNRQRYVQFSGGSNAQSSIIQFFDLVLSVEHRPTGTKQDTVITKKSPAPSANFIHDMRKYMPGKHARFLEQVGRIANIRDFVQQHSYDHSLSTAFDACLAMLSALRDKHMQVVSRYIIIQSAAAKKNQPKAGEDKKAETINLAYRNKRACEGGKDGKEKKELRGTGGSSLVSFLRQARDETGESAIDAWARRLLSQQRGPANIELDRIEHQASRVPQCSGLASSWNEENAEGGICYT